MKNKLPDIDVNPCDWGEVVDRSMAFVATKDGRDWVLTHEAVRLTLIHVKRIDSN